VRWAAKENPAMNIDMSAADESMDMPAHVRTYENFGSFVKYSIGAIAIVLIGMAIFLT
jgi:Bacterial aa3 type cytochrome c oxidase subunit IV